MSLQEHQEIQKTYPSYYAIIPAQVRYCKELEPSAKLFYGELTALCNTYGYCWASNSYFQELYDVDERTIRRWLESLSSAGFISVEINRKNFNQQRKIFINHDFQKMFTEGQNNPPGRTEDSGRPEKKARQSNTPSGTQEELLPEPEKPDKPKPESNAASRVVVSFDPLKIKAEKQKYILKKYSVPVIELAIKRTLAMNNRRSDEATLLYALAHAAEWTDTKTPQAIAVDNDAYLRSIKHYDDKVFKHTKIIVAYNYVAFQRGEIYDEKRVIDIDFIAYVKEKIKELTE